MGLFSRSPASTSSATLDKDVGPVTKDVYLTPREGITVTKKWTYDEEQLQKIEQLKEYTATLLLPESDPYHVWEKRFLDDVGTHARFMRAAKWHLENGKKRILATMEWRREFRPELIEPEDVAVEAETGKIVISGFDKDGRPIVYMRPRYENTETSPRQIRHLIYVLERAIDICPEGQDQVCIVVDYKQATSNNTPSVSTGLQALNILQHHYVERLGRGLVVNMPWWINAFFSAIQPFMDPITRDKIRFNPKLLELIDGDQLDREYGGEYNYVFEKDVYWPAVTTFCNIAEDGGRVDAEGTKFVPPSGNGAAWALQQHEIDKQKNGNENRAEVDVKVAPAAPAPADQPELPLPPSATAAAAVPAADAVADDLAKTTLTEPAAVKI
ncbi:hypothetical protein CcaverHIS002_0403160 [Cutaneotrichosporon cavernicola]|uniref:CRAL-TRIO domain-containing protein n=1 Tax=Cutaneotrichosporon cavernicola TaxID=279322 RepID=A0AA48L3X9_9TREE|nr:uncharacterized protein CcaverHIS019_0403120 [Cutaneotrichosporon cavernicola]BEI83712.1 hypothetical protein CcaverHIS002_0403160 [Cutaneotrichosporon cavernicola]BEI91492.1 hypothetical protein CcaverHIS019_0403120 [Cutaneotrichosporon cavernicola]BEI99267.1 hypothetical protein CcaverHIS631_0403100 [Cutaneotrichosporon cavernicola]BEJ07044.1 hypothetical protein CcaverHIS641_0403130 [Cutaneotrichosporon cavernicola]